MEWEKEADIKYPNIRRHGRPAEGIGVDGTVSVRNYLKCELYTYSAKTLALFILSIEKNPEYNRYLATMQKMVQAYGYSSLEEAENMMKETNPDIAIVTTMSLFSDVEESLMLCAKLGINAITTCEEAFYPMNSNPVATKKVDELAKQNGCTITGSGYQDIYWGQLISSIAGSTHQITKIKGSSSYNVEDYGIALAKAHGAGLTLEEFDKQVASVDRISDEERQEMINKGEYLPSYMWNVNGWLCAKLGLTVKSQTQKTVPQTHTEDIASSTLNMTVKAGDATGMSAVVTTETEEGITIESECIGKVYSKDDFDKNEWTIIGEPNTTLVINRPSTVELTCASIVNRIPDVINSRPGYVPTEEMGELNYRVKPLNEYVK